MRTFTFIMWFAAAVTSTTALAQSSASLTREQFIEKEQAERDTMAKKGYVWDQLYMRWDYIGWTADVKPAPMSRAQFLANEAREASDMGAKGFRWNQLYSRYDFVGGAAAPASVAAMSRQQYLDKEAAEAKAMQARGLTWNHLYQRWDRAR